MTLKYFNFGFYTLTILTVSLIRNKKKLQSVINIITKIERWPVFKQDPLHPLLWCIRGTRVWPPPACSWNPFASDVTTAWPAHCAATCFVAIASPPWTWLRPIAGNFPFPQAIVSFLVQQDMVYPLLIWECIKLCKLGSLNAWVINAITRVIIFGTSSYFWNCLLCISWPRNTVFL